MNLSNRYRYISEYTTDMLGYINGMQFRVQCRKWYSPFWKDIGTVSKEPQITRLIEDHKKRVTYVC